LIRIVLGVLAFFAFGFASGVTQLRVAPETARSVRSFLLPPANVNRAFALWRSPARLLLTLAGLTLLLYQPAWPGTAIAVGLGLLAVLLGQLLALRLRTRVPDSSTR